MPRAASRALIAAALVAAWSIGDHALPRGLPLGIALGGAVYGSIYALIALGIVLVYRANRVINFAQAEFGAVAAILAIEFVLQYHWPYLLAMGAGLVMAVVMGAVLELLVIRRFSKAPRLILAVVTIGLAEVLNGIAVLIPLAWTGLKAQTFHTPFEHHFTFYLYPKIFSGDYVVTLIVVGVVFAALASFLRFTDYGVAIRAAAENSDRANLLGVPVQRLSTLVWSMAGFMSVLAIMLRVPLFGFASFQSVSGGGFSLLLRTLAAAVIGGMTSLPMTAIAAVALGVMEELGAWTFSNSKDVDALLLVVILVALLARRERFARVAETGIGAFKALREVRPIPTEMRRLPEVRAGTALVKATIVVIALGVPLVATPSQAQLAGLLLIDAIVAVSLVVLTGWSGHISLGHWALVGFGAATTGTLLSVHGWDLFLALPAGMLVSAGAAFLIGLPALRIKGPFLAVTTLAFAVTSWSYFLNRRSFPWFVPDVVPRPHLWSRLHYDTDRQMYYVCLAGLVVVLLAVQNLRRTRVGRVLIAGRDNGPATQSMAINTTRMSLVSFALSGAVCGLAGGLYVLHQHGFKTDAFNPEVSLRLFAIVVIGGLGSVPGAILGAVYIRGAEYFLPPGWSILASGFGIVILLMFLPEGLGGLVYRVRDDLLRRVAARRSLVVPSLVADVLVDDEDEDLPLDAALESLVGSK